MDNWSIKLMILEERKWSRKYCNFQNACVFQTLAENLPYNLWKGNYCLQFWKAPLIIQIIFSVFQACVKGYVSQDGFQYFKVIRKSYRVKLWWQDKQRISKWFKEWNLYWIKVEWLYQGEGPVKDESEFFNCRRL